MSKRSPDAELRSLPSDERSPEEQARLKRATEAGEVDPAAVAAELAVEQGLRAVGQLEVPAQTERALDGRMDTLFAGVKTQQTPKGESALLRWLRAAFSPPFSYAWAGVALTTAVALFMVSGPAAAPPSLVDAQLLGARQLRGSAPASPNPAYDVGDSLSVRVQVSDRAHVYLYHWAPGQAVSVIEIDGMRSFATAGPDSVTLPPVGAAPLEVSGAAGVEAVLVLVCSSPLAATALDGWQPELAEGLPSPGSVATAGTSTGCDARLLPFNVAGGT